MKLKKRAWLKLDLHFRHADTAAGRPWHLNHGIWRVFAPNWTSQAHGEKEVVSRTVRSVNLTSWVSEPCQELSARFDNRRAVRILGKDEQFEWDRAYVVRKEAQEAVGYVG